MKYRILAPVCDQLLMFVPVEVYAAGADPETDAPLTTYPFLLRDSDTLESAALRLLEHMLTADTLLRHNERYAEERAQRFAAVKRRMEDAAVIGAVLTSAQVRDALLRERT